MHIDRTPVQDDLTPDHTITSTAGASASRASAFAIFSSGPISSSQEVPPSVEVGVCAVGCLVG